MSACVTTFMPRQALASGTLAVPAVLAATLLWGVSTSVAKLALDEWPPLSQAWLRFAVALALLVPLVRLGRGRLALGRVPALLGLTGVALFYALHNLGLHATSGINASLILDGGTPALTVVLGAMFLGERPRLVSTAGLLISLVGVSVVVLAAGPGGFGAIGYGDLLMLVSAGLWALYAVVGKAIFADQGVLPVITGSTFYGVLFLAPAALFEVAHVGPPQVTAQGAGLVLFLGLGCSALAYLLFGHALTHLCAWRVASWTTLMPLVGVIAAAILLREPILLAQMAGGALILVGVIVASRAEPGDAAQRSPNESVVWPSAPERKKLHGLPRAGSEDRSPAAPEPQAPHPQPGSPQEDDGAGQDGAEDASDTSAAQATGV